MPGDGGRRRWWWCRCRCRCRGGGGRNAEEALYCPPSNYARIIKVESHREYWRAVHSNCSLGIYTCGTPWIAPGPFRISPTPFLPASLSLSLFYFYACFLCHPPLLPLAVSPPFTPRKQWRCCPFSLLGPFPSRAFRSEGANFFTIRTYFVSSSLLPPPFLLQISSRCIRHPLDLSIRRKSNY